eukprot:Gregarina_sp_Poly_1__7102@NODE_3888_length_836_cov_30_231469_g2512_i0_p1_GENE_NODE_3888_length_836_cov_30_231469_g2512_i0NODE_3888_length_836_cov_30_231469_g2512_i0_p1_ORF_typecomplete_len110_score3_61EFhand_6/PF13405_6/0_0019EFhand_7/PF13499_6/0_0031Excalibur/PF05901_11/0_026EFhand_11/PF08976_11/0_02EFhand_5/PF13202_6/0_032_NODE_3888_length_836_cov_30_231469_g2512_i0189518
MSPCACVCMASERQWGSDFRSLDRDRDGIVSAIDLRGLFRSCGIRGTEEDAAMLVENVLEYTGARIELSVRSGLKGLPGRTLEQFCLKILGGGPQVSASIGLSRKLKIE